MERPCNPWAIMKNPRRNLLRLAASAAALATFGVFGDGALPQSGRTIKVIVPVPPGGGLDFLTRLLTQQIAQSHGVTMVVRTALERAGGLPPKL